MHGLTVPVFHRKAYTNTLSRDFRWQTVDYPPAPGRP